MSSMFQVMLCELVNKSQILDFKVSWLSGAELPIKAVARLQA